MEGVYDLFKESIVLVENYDSTKSYHDFEVEPLPYDMNKATDDIRFQIESDLYERFQKIKNLEKERDNLQNSLNIHFLPIRRDYPVAIELPRLRSSSDSVHAMSLISEAISVGDISPSEGEVLVKIIDAYVKAIEAHDYENRLNILEARK